MGVNLFQYKTYASPASQRTLLSVFLPISSGKMLMREVARVGSRREQMRHPPCLFRDFILNLARLI